MNCFESDYIWMAQLAVVDHLSVDILVNLGASLQKFHLHILVRDAGSRTRFQSNRPIVSVHMLETCLNPIVPLIALQRQVLPFLYAA